MDKELLEIVSRAITTTSVSAILPEDLSAILNRVTPKDCPMFSRLGRSAAYGLVHEWVESSLDDTLGTGLYSEGGIPSANVNSYVRRSNKTMSIGKVAKASGLLQAVRALTPDALALEIEDKMQNVIRDIEYYIFNGDSSATGVTQMDGLKNVITSGNGSTVIDQGTSGLTEAKLQEAIVGCYNKGGAPDMILARPSVAYRIANFTADKVRYMTGGDAGGVGQAALRYLSPFGNLLEVVPVRADFLPSGYVFIIESGKIKLAPVNGQELIIEPLAKSDDSDSRLIKFYGTLEARLAQHHAVITNVID
jgi:hypothetical protein